ncbi:DNA-3-methyladenine glycosylase family protein [Sinomonas sp. P47F7]|uniref:DNA-3-methyladenine glycosylase family protein n=1 Tax=Sinomonas sp. P47F7 TaxID=3410987 RepID=UPI003BF54FC5
MTEAAVASLRLETPGGLEPEAILGSLAAHTLPGAERTGAEERTHTRLVRGPRGHRALTLRFDAFGVDLDISTGTGTGTQDESELLALGEIVRSWFDLDADLEAMRRSLSADSLLGPLLAARPSLRVIGTPDRFQTAVTTVLGQQVSLAAGRTFSGRLIAAYGGDEFDGLRSFPEPATLVGADAEELRSAVGLTAARARTVQALAAVWLDARGAPTRSELLAVPGVGPWTVDYLGVRYGDRDAFTPGDLVLRKALGGITAREAEARSEAWRPFRAYALMHLWTHTAYTKGS